MNKILVSVSLWVFFATSMFSSQSAFAGPFPEPECSSDEDCPSAECAKGICVIGVCFVEATTDPCDDGNVCTVNDRCQVFECEGGTDAPKNTPCDDGNECTVKDVCDGGSEARDSVCMGEFAPLTRSCDDGDPCTRNDSCILGGCKGIPKDEGATCESDGNDCTGGVCVDVDPPIMDLRCMETPRADGVLCNDGNDCTFPDRCDGSGSCVGINDPAGTSCGDSSDTECTNPDTCDGLGECQRNDEPNLSACGDAATGCFFDPFCIGGICAGSIPKLGFECDDGNECTAIDVCDFEGKCFGVTSPGIPCGDSSDGECINPDSCDVFGNCQSNDEPDDTSCDDGELCTVDELCKDGVCGMGTINPIPACIDTVGGEIIPIESTSLILAGTQSTFSWLIPITVSAIGIAIVVARKFSKYQPE